MKIIIMTLIATFTLTGCGEAMLCDFNGDDVVTTEDINSLKGAFSSNDESITAIYDVNGDGSVDLEDLNTCLSRINN